MAALVASLVLGVGLFAAPEVLGYDGPARISHLIVGPIVASISLVAISDVLRELRWVNLGLGAWLVVSGLFLDAQPLPLFTGVVIGMSLGALSVVRGPINQRLGGGWRAVLDPDGNSSPDNGGTE